jgi:type VI secretion system secreted protein Hcp
MGIYLQLDGIESDATDKKHENWIACDSFGGGVLRPMSLETGNTLRETSRPDFHEISLRMKLHKGSPKVFLASLMGDARKAKIHVTRAADASGTLNFLEAELEDVFISSYSIDCDGDTPWETISLNYTKITQQYIPNGPDGKVGSKKSFGFNLKDGKKV